MSYSIFPTHRFEKELKRLAKKFPSLKNEFGELIGKISANPEAGTSIGNKAIKFVWPLVAKVKAKAEGQGLSLIYTLIPKRFICLPFMTKVKNPT
jgi:hypothetical protein